MTSDTESAPPAGIVFAPNPADLPGPTKFSVWAPRARDVKLCLGEVRHSLRRDNRGYWELELDQPAPAGGWRYRFSIDNGPPIPDPFSRWQPDGVHGDSALSDAVRAGPLRSAFRAPPLEGAVIYELHVGTFTPEGTYDALRQKLPHLVDLGVTHVELMPLATFPGRHGWGYDGVFLFAPHPAYGTPKQLKALVQDCHDLGLAVLLDVVYNHLGPDGNYLPAYGPCFAARKTLWGEALNFDEAGSDGMRQLVRDNATMWLRDYGFDGLRLDAVHAISDTRATHLLEELAEHVRALQRELDRPLVLIAESDLNDPRLVRPSDRGGYGLDAFWADDFHHAVHAYLTRESHHYYADYGRLSQLGQALREGYVYQGQHAPSRNRGHGRPPGDIARHQMVYCVQNHDQIGNRAQGERLAHLLSPPETKLAAALLFLAPGVPLLFQGEEWAATSPFLYFTDHLDPTLGQAVSEGRRREFPSEAALVPDPQDAGTFRASQLRWAELAEPAHQEMLRWYRGLIALRKEIRGCVCDVEYDEGTSWLVLNRGSHCAVFNFAAESQIVPLPVGSWQLLHASGGDTGALPGKAVRIYAAARTGGEVLT